MKLTYSIEDTDFREKLKKLDQSIDIKTRNLADVIAREVVNNARSLTNKTIPGSAYNTAGRYLPKGERTPRKAHPGNWADVTGQLANSIQNRIKRRGRRVDIIIEAVAEYAAALDAKTGYSVLGGAEIAARDAIAKYAPQIFD